MKNTAVTDNKELITAMFPGQGLIQQGNYYHEDEGNCYFIESIVPDSFVAPEHHESLVVVRTFPGNLSHARGFYQAHMAVFDRESGQLVSGVKLFSGDQGAYRIFESQGISYIFFAASTTYQGWSI